MIAAFLLATQASIVEEAKTLPGIGTTRVYRPADLHQARGVVLFVSGDGGWNLGVVDMARRIAPHAIVAGISMPAWQKRVEALPSTCWYPAGELETAAQALEKQYALPAYTPPILVGYSSGATVVYGALAQAPPTTFAGAVSLGFCPDLEVARRFCGKAGWTPSYDAKKHVGMLPESKDIGPRADGKPKWVALQGTIDQVCSPKGTVDFVHKVPGGAVISLEHVGHGFSVPARWGP
ncbi:MAG TPA: virulence factor family protein, partial [Candidatus Binatia bacterium]|nr:virulence factor family protein [Candidatus Binatia bacterium]